MNIMRNIQEFVVSYDASIHELLSKVNSSKNKTSYVVDEQSVLLGSFSDGDFRRWILNTDSVDLSTKLCDVMNKSCFSMSIDDDHVSIKESFSRRILSIPLLDSKKRLVAVAEQKPQHFFIENRRISEDDRCFIIAEIGNNHQGSVKHAKKLVDAALDANVDCVKFQMRDMGELYGGDSLESGSGDLGSEYTHDLLLKYQLKDEEMFELFDYCKSKDMLFMCTPWDISSFLKLEEYGVSAYKVASADFTNYDLLAEISQTGKLMFCSTGMSGESEIQSTISFLNKYDANYILLHCNSTYPAPFKDINLKYLNRLKDGSGNIVGYSGHERGSDIVIAAVALGAKVIEKHFTLDKTLEGNDHKVSLTPRELKKMVESIRNTEDSLGYSSPRSLTQGEMINRQVLSKSLIVNCSIKKGDFISREMIDIRSPGNGVQPNRLSEIVGTYAKRNFKSGEVIFDSDIKGAILRKEEYDFSRPYGIPVRFHDFYQLTKGVKLDFVEFHLSYKDLEVDPSRIFSGVSNMGFAVHSPELFISDHLMDLSAFDDQYRLNSIKALEQVIEMTNNLMQYFKQNTPPVVVINAGGWSRSGFLSDSEKTKKYALIKDALSAVNSENVIIAIQTMPPFPWHFGGQSYHNLFVDPHEIVGFCKDVPVKICLDVSHSMMACSHYGWDLYDFVSLIAPYTVHLHIVDALGSDGEGIQIGDGDVDFDKLLSILDDKLIDIPFIPEVWQGHQDHGQGFWYALDFLERHGY